MIYKYYYLFTRPSVTNSSVLKVDFFQVSSIFSVANNLDHFWMGGIGGRNFMLVRGENLPMKYPWGEPRGTSWKCVPPWGRKRAELVKFCIEGSVEPGALFWIQGRKFQKQGQNLCHQGRNIEVRGAILGPPGAGFFNYVNPGGWTCQVMHSGGWGT